ncbi:uncharacterized protein LOC111297865 [Durio zibethinus]|uniref:Uncharacterized protein LOC111297865 n=1 Tax=Durio zibethinus TaxID=66656 RepID=A0A6P5Z5Z7_DURZI|nr:uncharacterized protein LOC111297865 [Durio zibethinus]
MQINMQLELQYANETENLYPPHDYVPWVVVNNQPIRDDFENFVKYVCQAYKGDHVPEACKAQSSNVSSTNKKANKIHLGCYGNEFRNLESSTAAKQARLLDQKNKQLRQSPICKLSLQKPSFCGLYGI